MQHYNQTRCPRVIELKNGIPYTGDPTIIGDHAEFRQADLIVGDVVEASNGFFVITDPETGDYTETTRDLVDQAWNPNPDRYTPRVDQSYLLDIADLVLEEYSEHKQQIISIFEYDAIAKNYAGYEFAAGDVDVQVLFTRDADVTSTSYQPKRIGELDGLEVEVMRNTVPVGTSPKRYAQSMDSSRWEHILENPKVQVYPEIELLDW